MKIGVVVNPIAGMGGRVGLKGTDGAETLKIAIERHAQPIAPSRTIDALRELVPIRDQIQVFTGSGEMGEVEAVEVGLNPIVVQKPTFQSS